MPEVNFRNIRKHRTSQEDGFEELCCQLLSLRPPSGDAVWIRKDGAGGDAGVEGFWRLANGSEICLQAKFFFELGASQWQQIDESVTTMLKKHPDCTEYIICLPINLGDGRKTGKKGQREKWNDRVAAWSAIQPSRKVHFELWDESKLTKFLTQDDPQFSGRRRYWFDEKVLSKAWLEGRLKEALENLGDRYTPEMHVDLPIAKRLSALVRDSSFWRHLSETPNLPSVGDKASELKQLEHDTRATLEPIVEQIKASCRRKTFLIGSEEVRLKLSKLEENASEFKMDDLNRDDVNAYYQFQSGIRAFDRHIYDSFIEIAEHNTVFVVGEGGSGKSHLLADFCARCQESEIPAVLLLGQHFVRGAVWPQIRAMLGFDGSDDEFLGALDAAGQASGSRALLAIDALNEGAGSAIWPDQLAGLIERVTQYPHIGMVVSCRSTYEKRITRNLKDGKAIRVTHHGFAGHEEKAAQIYMDKRGIARPSAPMLAPEFSNPLFLSTICNALQRRGETTFPKGLRGVSSIFDYYFESVCEGIERELDLDPAQHIVARALSKLIEEILASDRMNILYQDAVKIADTFCPSQGLAERSLVTKLISAGVLANDIHYTGEEDGRGEEVVRVTYERYLDHLRANQFIDAHVQADNPAQAFRLRGSFRKIVEDQPYLERGFIEALSVQIPERFGSELWNLIEWKEGEEEDWAIQRCLQDAFAESLLWRDPDATSKETVELLNTALGGMSDRTFDTLVKVTTEPGHALNATLLHRNLYRMELAERDSIWSTWAARHWHRPEEGSQCALWVLVHWAWIADKRKVEEERLWLASLTLSWALSAPKRELRDKATKALVSLVGSNAHLMRRLLLTFDDVDDFYILERLYCVAYGVAMRSPTPEVVEPLARTVGNRVFRSIERYDHLLLRDYASGILQLAGRLNVLPKKFSIEDALPPFRSEWPLDDVAPSTIEALRDEMWGVHSSVMGPLGDFGTYIMDDVFKFSPTGLAIKSPETWEQLRKQFEERLAEQNPAGLKALHAYEKAQQDEHDARMRASDGTIMRLVKQKSSGTLQLKTESKRPRKDAKSVAEKAKRKLELATTKLDKLLSEGDTETSRWLQRGHRSRTLAKFSRRKAMRWVVKNVADTGWTKKRFESFERTHASSYGRNEHNSERVGKKYQWIAYHQLLARISDHCHHLNWNDEPTPFMGAWQLGRRDIDPSYLVPDKEKDERAVKAWWEVPLPDVSGKLAPDEASAWIADLSDLPPDFAGVERRAPCSNDTWLAIDTDSTARGTNDFVGDYRLMTSWVTAVLIHKSDIKSALRQMKGKDLSGFFTHQNSDGEDAFLGEHPWHPTWATTDEAFSAHKPLSSDISMRCHFPCQSYARGGGYDHSMSEAVKLTLPSKFLVRELELQFDFDRYCYSSSEGQIVWLDPRAAHHDGATALIKKDVISPWLISNNCSLLWVVTTQKQFIERRHDRFLGELSDHQVIVFDGKDFHGDRWTFLRERGPVDKVLRKPFKMSFREGSL